MTLICNMKDIRTFEERKALYEEELIKLGQKYQIDIYPANIVMQNGEVMPMIIKNQRSVAPCSPALVTMQVQKAVVQTQIIPFRAAHKE